MILCLLRVSVRDLRKRINKIQRNKSASPDAVSVDFLKATDEAIVSYFYDVSIYFLQFKFTLGLERAAIVSIYEEVSK